MTTHQPLTASRRLTATRTSIALASALAMFALSACSTDPAPAPAASPTAVGQATGTPTPSETDVPTESTPETAETSTAVPTKEPTQPTTAPTKAPAKPQPTKPQPTKEPAKEPVRIILERGDSGAKVRDLQARLKQLGWFSGDVSDTYGPKTASAISGFQGKRGYSVTGSADEKTYNKVLSMSRRPTADELNNVKPKPTEPTTTPTKPSTIKWDVDERCLTKGKVICISKSTRSLTFVIDGVPQYSMDVRFGSEQLPTREGVFSVFRKKVDVISNIYHTPMPYSMFFSGGQAVHYSSNFARLGYNGSSHGCVNVRDMAKLKRLYAEAPLGTKLVVHW